MKGWLLALLVLCDSGTAEASDFRLLELDEMSMDFANVANNRDGYWPYEDPGRDRYETEETWRYAVGVNFDLALAAFKDYRLHWRNRVDGQQTTVQFRTVTWDFRWGLELGRKVELFYDHTSAHLLDEAPEADRTYRLKNVYGIAFTFVERKP